MKFIYQESTQTVRSIPQNYCVTAIRTFAEDGSTDAALGDLNKLGKLLAAAPEMFDLLNQIYIEMSQDDNRDELLYSQVIEIVNKAKGE